MSKCSLKNKINAQNQKINEMEQEAATLRNKQKTVIEYANQRLQEVMG